MAASSRDISDWYSWSSPRLSCRCSKVMGTFRMSPECFLEVMSTKATFTSLPAFITGLRSLFTRCTGLSLCKCLLFVLLGLWHGTRFMAWFQLLFLELTGKSGWRKAWESMKCVFSAFKLDLLGLAHFPCNKAGRPCRASWNCDSESMERTADALGREKGFGHFYFWKLVRHYRHRACPCHWHLFKFSLIWTLPGSLTP